jgi:hypothetical protein
VPGSARGMRSFSCSFSRRRAALRSRECTWEAFSASSTSCSAGD